MSNLGLFAAALLFAAGLLGLTALGANAATTNAATESSWSNRTVPHLSESAAKDQIVIAGYTNPSDLQKTQNGWTAKANESGHPVSLMVNDFGSVEKQ
jgi:hypothetical protein